MEGKMNVVVIMMLAFVGFAASGACVTDGVDTQSPNTVFSYEDTHSEVVVTNYLEVELKRTDHYDVVEMSWFSSWKGIGKGNVARSRLYIRGESRKTFLEIMGSNPRSQQAVKLHPLGRGRYLKQEDFVTRLPEMEERAAKWGADHRTLLRNIRRTTTTVSTKWHHLMQSIKDVRVLQTHWESQDRRVMEVSPETGRRQLTTREDIRRYGAMDCVGFNDPPDRGELSDDDWKDLWVDSRGSHWHKVTEEDYNSAVAERRQLQEDFTEAWDDLTQYTQTASEFDLPEIAERVTYASDSTPRGWNLELNPNKWGFTGEHEVYYLNVGGMEEAKLVDFIRDSIHAMFKNSRDVSIRVAVDHNNTHWNRDKFSQSEYNLQSITQFNITDDCSLGSNVRSSGDYCGGNEYLQLDCVDYPDALGYQAMSLEINIGVGNTAELVRNLKTYFDALHGASYPLATPPGYPPFVVGPACSTHIHGGPFGYADTDISASRNKFRELRNLDRDEPERVYFVRWMTTLLDNWCANIELFEGTMPHSRRHSVHFAAHMNDMNEMLIAARAITEFARSMGKEVDAQYVKDEFECLMQLRDRYYRITGNSMENVSDETRQQFEEWDGLSAPPERLAKMVRTSLTKWDKVFFEQVGRARENSGDGGHYAGLNLNSLERRGTIEFRQFGQTNNWKSLMRTIIQVQSLMEVSKSGIPMTFISQPDHVVAKEDKHGNLTGNGVSALARLMVDTIHHPVGVLEFLEDEGITELAELNPDAVTSAHMINTDGGKSIRWRSASLDSSFVDSDDASVTGLGMGLMGVVGLVSALSPMVAAITMMVGCGIGFYVNRNLIHKSGAIEDAADIQPLPPTNREVKGLLKAVPALASRGEQGFGIGKLHRDGVMTACWEVRKPDVKVTNNYGGRETSYMKKDTTNIPHQLGALAMKALNGGYNLRREDYDGLVYIYHTRYSTGGTSDKLNAHPHYVGAPIASDIPIGIFGAHNGVIYNDREVMGLLPKDFLETIKDSLEGLNVDTRAIWASLALFGSDNDGIDKMAQLVDGSMRLMWFDRSERRDGYPPRLHLWSNTPDLWIGFTKGPEGGQQNIVGASTERMLKDTWGDSLDTYFEAKLFHHYIVDYQMGLIDMGPCGEVDHSYGADDWQGGSSGKKTPATTNTTPASITKQLGLQTSGRVQRQRLDQPIDPNYVGDCGTCEDGDLLYGSIEECPACGLTLDEVVDAHYAKLGAACDTSVSNCSSPTVAKDYDTNVPNLDVKATPEATEDLGLKTLFDDMEGEASASSSSSDIPPVGSGDKLKKYVAEANKEAAKKVVDKTKTNHPVTTCAACHRPPETCDADPCVVETARRSRELGLSILHEQKTKKSNPQALGYVVMRKCGDKLCCSMEQPHERIGHDDKGASIFECMGPCGWKPKPEAESEWQKEFADCACPTADDHDCCPVSPCEGSADYKAKNPVTPPITKLGNGDEFFHDLGEDGFTVVANDDDTTTTFPAPGEVIKKGVLSQKMMDWIDNELAGGNTINITALSDVAQEYLRKRLSEGNLA